MAPRLPTFAVRVDAQDRPAWFTDFISGLVRRDSAGWRLAPPYNVVRARGLYFWNCEIGTGEKTFGGGKVLCLIQIRLAASRLEKIPPACQAILRKRESPIRWFACRG